MNKYILIIGVVVLLSVINVNAADESLGVFSASIVEQTPAVVPAIALEHGEARVKVFISLSSLAISNVQYRIDKNRIHVGLYRADSSGLIQNVRSDMALNDVNISYDNIFNPFNETIIVADIFLKRVTTGREIRVVEDETAEKICSGQLNDTKSISELIPDELNVTLRIPVVFRACKDGEFDKDGKECVGGRLLSSLDYKYPDDYDDDSLNRCLINVENNYKGDEAVKQKEVCYKRAGFSGLFGGTITDYVYVDTVIGIDKTNLDRLIGPEEMKNQICRTLKWRKEISKWINKTQKVENVFQSTCLLSVLGGAFNILRGDVCDARDSISLGCDWIFCPSDECHGFNPMNSIITASTMCWDFNKRFFGKDLGYNVIVDKIGAKKDVNVLNTKYLGEEDFKTRPEKGDEIGQFTAPVCDYKNNDTSGSIPIPHYACITGVEANLEVINKMIGSYQECLIQARLGGVSVGWCDKLRSYYLCDRVLGEALEFAGAGGATGLLGKFFGIIIGKPLDLIIPGDSSKFYGEKRAAASDLKDLSIARYQNVPFIQLVGKEKQFIKNEVCNAFISGDLFSLESMKQSLGLLDTDYPDSAFIITEKRPWSRYESGGKLLTDEYSYDVFFQIYNGKKSRYGGSGHYNVFLRVLYGENCDKVKTIPIKSGIVREGEMVQENEFKIVDVKGCQDEDANEGIIAGLRKSPNPLPNGDEQCLKFKGKYVCAPIGQILSFATDAPYDPFGFTMFDDNDKDNNGFSDNWELKYFGLEGVEKYGGEKGDADGDGYCNAEEYLAGTDPTNKLLHPTSEPDCNGAIGRLDKEDMDNSQQNQNANLEGNEEEKTECADKRYDVMVGPEGDYSASCDDLEEDGEFDHICEVVSGDVVDSSVVELLEDEIERVEGLCEEYEGSGTELNDCFSECTDDNGCVCKAYGCEIQYGNNVDRADNCGGDRNDLYGGSYDLNNNYFSPHKDDVVALAQEYDVPILLALGVAAKESSFKHCCSDDNTVCSNPDSREVCSRDDAIKNPNEPSYGIFAINENYNSDCFEIKDKDERDDDSICYKLRQCDDTNLFDLRCNIAAGLNKLKKDYSTFGNSGCIGFNGIIEACNECSESVGPLSYYFYNYRGWDAALRAYNGWACNPDTKINGYVADVRHIIKTEF